MNEFKVKNVARLEAELEGIVKTAQGDRCMPTNLRSVSRQGFVNLCRDVLSGR